jgi:hypothetical protein
VPDGYPSIAAPSVDLDRDGALGGPQNPTADPREQRARAVYPAVATSLVGVRASMMDVPA